SVATAHVVRISFLTLGALGEIAEVILDGFAVARRHALGQVLKGTGLLARGHPAPFLDELAHLDGIDASGAAALRKRAIGHGRVGVVPGTGLAAAVGAAAAVGLPLAGLLLGLVLQLLDQFVEAE